MLILIVWSEVRQEVRPSDQKLLNRTYYYIDFKMFVDVLKYRMYMMKKSIEDQMKNVRYLALNNLYNFVLGDGE